MQLPVDPLIAALRVHADTMTLNLPGGSPMPAINALRETALAYVKAVSELTGWGNVFADLYEEEDDDEFEDDETGSAMEGPVSGFTVLRRYDYAVTDEQAVMEAGREACKVVWPDDSEEAAVADVDHLGRALYQIAHAHGWDSLAGVEGLRPLGGTTLLHRQDELLSTDPDEWPDDMFDTEGEDLYQQSDVFGPPPK